MFKSNINTQLKKKKILLKNTSVFSWTASSYSVCVALFVYHWKQKHNLICYLLLRNIHQDKKKRNIHFHPTSDINYIFVFIHIYVNIMASIILFYQGHIMNSKWWVLMTIVQLLVCLSSFVVVFFSILFILIWTCSIQCGRAQSNVDVRCTKDRIWFIRFVSVVFISVSGILKFER